MRMLGALVRPRAAEPIFNRGFSLKKKRATRNGNATRIRQGSAKDPPRIRQGANREHTLGSNAPRDAQERIEGTRTADGTREMEGSNTPWAQGPANSKIIANSSKS